LIGNLTRDPELRYTASGRAICAFGLATNRSRKTDTGELREESSFHRIIAWEKLAEQCAQLLIKGRKVYAQGRLAYRIYQKDDEEREVAEIVIEDMLHLDNKPAQPASTDTPHAMGSGAAPSNDKESNNAEAPLSSARTSFTDEEIADAIPI
jgi:single-strand DNA-binding protein